MADNAFPMFRLVPIALASLLVAAACSSGDQQPVSLAQYQDEMQAIENSFEERGGEIQGELGSAYAINSDLVTAASLHGLFQDRLEGWRSLEPPPGVAELHNQLVAKLALVQEAVGDYVGTSSMEGEEFAFESIAQHPEIRMYLSEASDTCRQLRRRTAELGFAIDFAFDCQI